MTSKPDTRGQAGFTLVELLVVLLIIGVLAAIALPAFGAQRIRAEDADAKSNARNLASLMESCHATRDSYLGCPEGNTGIPLGPNPGQVEVDVTDGSAYELVAHSVTGNTFTLARHADDSVSRSCSTDGGDTRGGCIDGKW